jgi:hypothetical protein
VTTDNTDFTSAIDQDQAQLDYVQEGEPQADSNPMTGEIQALRQLVEQQNRQVAGLQSKVDKGLNAIRRDTENSAREQQEAAAVQYIQELPEEHQGAFNSMLNANKAFYEENQKLKEQNSGGTQPSQEAPTTEAQNQWEEVYSIPRSLGIDPNVPGIDYAAFTDPGLSESQRRDRFFASLRPMMGATNQAPTTQSMQTPTSQVQNPPIGGTPASGAASNVRSIYQAHSAYAENKLTKNEYKDLLNKLGQ